MKFKPGDVLTNYKDMRVQFDNPSCMRAVPTGDHWVVLELNTHDRYTLVHMDGSKSKWHLDSVSYFFKQYEI